MNFIEFSTSAGPGTLIAHGVREAIAPLTGLTFISVEAPDLASGWKTGVHDNITEARYHDFIAIHGSERAV